MSAQGEEKQVKASLAAATLRMWPALPYLGLGLWLAWSFLAFSGGVWLSDVETNGENISKLFMTSSVTLAITSLVSAFNSSLVSKLLNNRRFLVFAGALGGFGSLLLVLAGPYYIGAFIGTGAYAIFYVGGALTGIASSMLLLKCGMIYSLLTPRRVLLYSSLAHLLLACIFFVVLGVPSWHPLEGGPPLSGVVALVLSLPAAALLLSMANFGLGSDGSAGEAVGGAISSAHEAEHLDIEPQFASTAIHKLPTVFWKFLIMALFFAVVIFMMRGVIVELHPVEVTLGGSSIIMFLRLLMALVFAALALGSGSKRLNFGKVYSLTAVVLVVVIALLPMLGVLDSNWNFVISAAIMVFEFTLWCLLAFVSYQRQVSPVIVMGFGYGIYMLGNTAGWLLGSSGLPGIIEGPMVSVFYLLVAGAVLVLAFLLFSERDFERLFAPADLASASLSELMQEDILNSSQAASSEGADEQPQEHRRGRFMQQVGELARAKKLSPRETEVLRFLAMGRSSDFISEQLSISWNTARTHIHNVYVKLNVHSREELMNLMDSLKMS